jgi:hypothetical protein
MKSKQQLIRMIYSDDQYPIMRYESNNEHQIELQEL